MCCRFCSVTARLATARAESLRWHLRPTRKPSPLRKPSGPRRKQTMPPWFADPTVGKFSNDSSLSAEEIDELAAWAENGAVAGDPHEAPPPRTWAASWTIPQPDLVLKIPQAVRLPANGDV